MYLLNKYNKCLHIMFTCVCLCTGMCVHVNPWVWMTELGVFSNWSSHCYFFLRHSVSTEPGAPWFSQTEWPGNWESLVFVSPVLAFIGADQHNPHVSARDLNSSTPSCTSIHLTYWIFPACTWQLRNGFWIWKLRWFLHEHTDIHPSYHEAGVALDSFALRNAKT